MKYSSLFVNNLTCKVFLFCTLLICLSDNISCKVNYALSQSENVIADFTSNSLDSLANSKVLKLKRYQIKMNYNKIQMILPHSQTKEIRLKDIIILKENTVFFNSLSLIKKLITNEKRIQQLYLVMSKLRSNFYSNINNCRFFFSNSYSNNRQPFNLKFIQFHKGGNNQKNFNIMCFTSHHAKNFDTVFGKIYQNYIKNVRNIENLHFFDKNIPREMFTLSTIKIDNPSKGKDNENSSKYKYFNFDNNEGIVSSSNNKNSNIKFQFKLERIVDCEVKTIQKGNLLCILFKLGENGVIGKSVKICPNDSNYLKKLISFVYMKFSLGNTCKIKVGKAITLMLKSGVKIDKIPNKLKPSSLEFSKNNLESHLQEILYKMKQAKGNTKKELAKTFKKVGKIGREILLKIKDNKKNLYKLIDKILNKSKAKSTDEKPKEKRKKKANNKQKIKREDSKDNNKKEKKMKKKKKEKKKTYKKKKGNKKSKSKSKSESAKSVSKNKKIPNKTQKRAKHNNTLKNESIIKNKTKPQNKTTSFSKEHKKKYGEEINNLYNKNMKNINMDLLSRKYADYFNPKKNSTQNDKRNSNASENNNQLDMNKMILFQTKLPFIMKPGLSSSSFLTAKGSRCRKIDPPILDACDKNDIYCLCKNHPNYKGCVCAAYPKSVVCIKNYCKEHPKEYECNPKRCDNEKTATCKDCFCKKHVKDVKCRCKTDPYSKECFCTQNPLSHLCNMKACRFNPNSLFCACRTNLRPEMCDPTYCIENPLNPYCKCVVNPGKDECRCLNDPISCKKENEFSEAIVEYDLKIRDSCAGNKLYYSINPYQNNKKSKKGNFVVLDKSMDPGLMDPTAIYNMYYPPCKYDPDKPYALPTEPCIPFPEPPKACKDEKKSSKKTKIIGGIKGPCLKNGCIKGLKKKKKSKRKVILSVDDKNKNNLQNLMKHQNNPDTLMLYNKWLLFNTNCNQKKGKSVTS